MEKEYRIGEEAIYYAEGEHFRVRVMENNSDEANLSYRLRIMEIIEKEKENISQIGDIFSVQKERQDNASKIWHLSDE